MKQRIGFIDTAKGLGIICVVIFHFDPRPSCLNYIVPPIIMPLFFIISGLLFKRYDTFSHFLNRKINSLLVPFMFFSVIAYILLYLKRTIFHLPSVPFFQSIIHEYIPCNGAVWFLFSLFTVNCFFYLILSFAITFKNHSTIILIICSLVIGMAGFIMGKYQINLPLWIDSSLTATPFVTFGYLLKKYSQVLKDSTGSTIKFIALSIILIIVSCLTYSFFDLFSNSTVDINFIGLYLCGLSGSLAILLISKIIGEIPIVSYFGKYSLCILTTHFFIERLVLDSVITRASDCFMISLQMSSGICAILFLLSYLFIIPIMIRIIPHMCGQKDLVTF